LIRPYLQELKELNITDINVSLDALSREKFLEISRRDVFDEVNETLLEMIERGFQLKINCVLMSGKNEDQIIPLLELAKEHPLSVRFLEEMPFNGLGEEVKNVMTFQDILNQIEQSYTFHKLKDEYSSTSMNYGIAGFKGTFGVIPSFSRTFCGTCNRLRLSATGEVRTCLYGGNELNIKDRLRAGDSALQIQEAVQQVVGRKPKDGFEAAALNKENYLSMTKLGG
jgi:cyclic pyranopterin phosphate synthase